MRDDIIVEPAPKPEPKEEPYIPAFYFVCERYDYINPPHPNCKMKSCLPTPSVYSVCTGCSFLRQSWRNNLKERI